jgi:sodium/hydrogen antiporter
MPLPTPGPCWEPVKWELAIVAATKVTFLIFGAVLLGPTLKHVSRRIALYAVLRLTLIRMVPVAISMLRSGAKRQTAGFLGWFGPRGLASIVFAVITVQEAHLAGADTILLTAY